MTAPKSSLDLARASFDRRAWGDAFGALARAEGVAPLDRDDLERLAWAAALRGSDQAFLGALERLYNACIEANETRRAARAAFWIGFRLISLGGASGPGWLARAARLVEAEKQPCAERGYLLVPTAYRHLAMGEDAQAERAAREAGAIGETCGDRDLVALAQQIEGRALLRQGRIDAGLAVLDEVMLSVTSDELTPHVTGLVYCQAIACCQEVYAIDRMREWTAALSRWCKDQAELVTFTGICLVHRVEIMQLGGAWREATRDIEALTARENMGDPEIVGDAWYQRGELLRLRGDVAGAEKSYRLASENGREPQPGLALLRLLQGDGDSAASTMQRVLSTATVKWERARLLPAFVEIMLATGRIEEARTASRELEDIACELGTEILGAMAAHARGAVAIAEGEHRAAVEPLRRAFALWNRAGVPYIAARIRVLLARAFLALGDRDGAELERSAARKVFEELGAAPEIAAFDAPHDVGRPQAQGAPPKHGLSKRELEVLRLLASGKTNKAIGKELYVSERTIDRHVSNIFAKIGVGTRSAATAFIYENGLL
jgi:DNA-binding NarL/FixJ family response regulator